MLALADYKICEYILALLIVSWLVIELLIYMYICIMLSGNLEISMSWLFRNATYSTK